MAVTLGRALAPLEITEVVASRRMVSVFAIATSGARGAFPSETILRRAAVIFAAIGNMVAAIGAVSAGQVQVEGNCALLTGGQAVYSQPVESLVLQVVETVTKNGIATPSISLHESGRMRAAFLAGLKITEGPSVTA